MVSWIWILVAAIVVVAIAAACRREVSRRRRSETELQVERRQRRMLAWNIRPLASQERERYSNEWRRVQTRFVDDPRGAVCDADRLVGELMHECGYPMEDFEQRATALAADHPVVVSNYSASHAIAERDRSGGATTEDLRQAMVHYRALFEELLGERMETERSKEAELWRMRTRP